MKIKINDYVWNVEFVSKDDERMRGVDGRTLYNDFLILIRDDLNKVATKEVLIHEITHATLGMQGRCYQKKFDLEEVCEFVGFNGKKIIDLAEKVMYGRN